MRAILAALRSGHWPSLFGAWLHFEVSFTVWLLIGALSVSIADEFGLTATQKGLLVAFPLLGGALLRVFVGAASDWYGAKSTALVLLGFELAAVVWGWTGTSTYEHLLVVGLLLGAAGASFAVALPIASRAYPPAHQGLAMGIAASANSGTVLAMLFAPRAAQVVGWRGVFGLMIIPIIVTMLLCVWLVRSDRSPLQKESRPRWREGIQDLLKRPSMYWLCFVYAVTFGGFVGLCSILPIFLHDQYGLDLVTAGSVAALCGLVGSVVRPFGGYVADRLGGLSVLQAVCVAIAGLVALIGQLPLLSVMTPLLVGATATMGFGNGAVFQIVSAQFQKQIGLASGLIGAAGGLGGFFLPVSLGTLKDLTGSFQTGLWLFAGLALCAALMVAVALRRHRSAAGEVIDLSSFSR